jgi:hypothetical protein
VVGFRQNKLFVVLEGTVDVCVLPVEKFKDGAPVSGSAQVSTLLNSCRTLRAGDMYQFFGTAANPEVLCASSSQQPASLLSLSTEAVAHLAELPAYEKLAKFGSLHMAGILRRVTMFKGMTDRELDALGALLDLRRVHAGHALTQRGRAGHDDGERSSAAHYWLCYCWGSRIGL